MIFFYVLTNVMSIFMKALPNHLLDFWNVMILLKITLDLLCSIAFLNALI